MNRYRRREQFFAVLLAALAGYVDALGFLKAGGFFVSFMSGNSTRLAVGLVRGAPSAVFAAGLIGSFVLGVVLGTMVAERARFPRRSVLLLVSTLLLLAGLADRFGLMASVAIAAAAMGAENAIFSRDGDVQIGLTYMTGTLVKFAQSFAYLLMGRTNTRWISFAILWGGLVSGAILGAFTFKYTGAEGFIGAGIMALILGAFAPRAAHRST